MASFLAALARALVILIVVTACTGALIVATSRDAQQHFHGRGLDACFLIFTCMQEPSLVEHIHSHMMAWGLSGIALRAQ